MLLYFFQLSSAADLSYAAISVLHIIIIILFVSAKVNRSTEWYNLD